jgi:SAM-dependent methyltransferase
MIIDLAWMGLPNYNSSIHIEKNFIPRYLFLKRMIESGVKDIAALGTCFEYGVKTGELSEDMPCDPKNSYAIAKDSLRRALFELQHEHDFSLKWIRLFYVYGPFQNPESLIPLLMDSINKEEKEFKMSGGEQIRDYMKVKDACLKIINLAFNKNLNGIVNCCSGKGISVRSLVESIIKEKKSSVKPHFGYYPYSVHEAFSFWGSSKKYSELCLMDKSKCPLCGSHKLYEFYRLRDIPFFQNKVYQTRKEAVKVPCGNVILMRCSNCSFVFNSAFNAENMQYDSTYQNEQNYSSAFEDYLENVTQVIKKEIKEKSFKNAKILEVGCGKGFFLEKLKSRGFQVLGIDPAYEGSRSYIIKDYFTEKYACLDSDLIILRHTLEHVADPRGFIESIVKANKARGMIYIEIPDLNWIIKNSAFWDIYYEHCNYFTARAIKSLFSECTHGYAFNGQYQYVMAKLKDFRSENFDHGENIDSEAFEKLVFTGNLERYRKLLNDDFNCTTFVWGVGAKGVAFLNTLDRNRTKAAFAVDINPKKQNHYTAGSGHLIISPSLFLEKAEQIEKQGKKIRIIVMNPNYKKEVENLIEKRNYILITL